MAPSSTRPPPRPRAGARRGPRASRGRRHPPYAELRAASSFSFLRASADPEELARRAAELELPAVALADRNGVYGAPRFHRAAREAGVRALVGAEIALEPRLPPRGTGGRRGPQGLVAPEPDGGPQLSMDPDATGSRAGASPLGGSGLETESRLTLLAGSREGYRNLCRLLTRAATGRPKGEARISWDALAEHSRGLHCLTGGDEGPVPQALEASGIAGARRLLEHLGALFPGRLHLELQRHRLRREEHRNRALVELAGSLRLPLVATNGVRYARPEGKELLDVLTAIRHGAPLDLAGRLLEAQRQRHLKGAREMAELFPDHPEALAGSFELAQRLDFTLENLGYRFPDYPLPGGETPDSYLRHLTWNGARARFRPLTARAQAQVEKELALIEKLGLAGYFLIVWDLIRFCQEEGILVQGRGSAANSAVCYALSITAVDPVKMDLLFERFLSEERGEWPDIDLDLPSGDQREKVIQYVYRRYGDLASGKPGAAMTANVITYRDRSAAREVAKALGYSSRQQGQLSKALRGWSRDLARGEGDHRPLEGEVAAAGFDPAEPRMGLFLRLWQEIQHLPRHLGQHSGGMVIAAGRLDEVVPLEPASMEGRVVIQWDKEDCADLGIIKVDLLGLGMLNALEEAVPLIRRHEKVHIDLAHLPPDDPKTYRMLQEADTVGVFQVESRAQMASLPRNRPERFYDLVIQVAIIRPGPIAGNLAHPFFERRRGRQPVRYPHPLLEPILRRTLGVPIFQEQILKIAMVAAGFTGGEAEELRRAMGFKRSVEAMDRIVGRLRSGMAERGIPAAAREQIEKSITSFALYGFPESHAASFALIAYASAYLKAHHPTAFTIALLNAWPMGFYHPSTVIEDAVRHGVRVLPIDVQRSAWRCTWEGGGTGEGTAGADGGGEPGEAGAVLDLLGEPGEETPPSKAPSKAPPSKGGRPADPALRLGLRFVRGLRASSAERLVSSREDGGPFTSPENLARRADLQEEEMAVLASIGALGSLGLSRREALWQAARIRRSPGPLFEDEPDTSPSPLPEMTPVEETLADFAGASVTTGPHPMVHLRAELKRKGVLRAVDLARFPAGARVTFGGAVIVRQRPGTAQGVLFLTLEDETGMAQAIVAPEMFREHRSLILGSRGLVVEGELQKRDGSVSVKAAALHPLEGLAPRKSHDFR